MGMVAILVKWPKYMYMYDFSLNSNRKMNISRFSNINALDIKFGLAVKKVKVNPDSSFVQTW